MTYPARHDANPADPRPTAPEIAPDDPRVIDRAARDRLVIFDPACAPLIRPLILAADLRPWHVAEADRWLITIPPALDGPPLAERHPALAKQLASAQKAAGAGQTADGKGQTAGQGGLTLDVGGDPAGATPRSTRPQILEPLPAPRILIAIPALGRSGPPPDADLYGRSALRPNGALPPDADAVAVAWDDSGALVSAAIQALGAAAPLDLALLGSAAGRARLAAGAPPARAARELLPAGLPGPAREHLAGLALSLAKLSHERHQLERRVLRRLLADFAPPGAAPTPRLTRWWALSFDELRAELVDSLRNDIPERYRPTWAESHTEQRHLHAQAGARIAALEEALEQQVERLGGV